MKNHDEREANQRLLEALSTEELTHTEQRGVRPVATARRLRSPWTRWVQAAAVALGAGVVAATATGGDRASDLAQDPAPVEEIKPKDVAEFLSLLATATQAELFRAEVVGAGRLPGAGPHGVDKLDRIHWAETTRIAGATFERWRAGLRRCAQTEQVEANGVADVYDIVLTLPGRRVLRTFTSVDGPRTQLWVAPSHAISPDAGLQALLDAACADIVEKRRLTMGKVDDEAQLLAHPRDARRLDLTTKLASGCDLGARFPRLEQLTLRGQPSPTTWRAVAELKQLQDLTLIRAELHQEMMRHICAQTGLRKLTLSECSSAQTSGLAPCTPLHDLGALRGLKTLHLVNNASEAVLWDLTQLVSLPSLREFGLSSSYALKAEDLEAIGRTKIERLLLVDLDVDGDLSSLRYLPSLRDLVLVGDLDDDQLRPLASIPSLNRLTIRNASAKGDFLEDVAANIPGCDVDWTVDARWWHADYAFRYIKRAWGANR